MLFRSYAAGGSTPLATYTDSTGGTANANPVILDVYGSASLWLNNEFYKYVVKDADDVTIWTLDNIGWGYIFQDNNTWTGTNTFNNVVTFNDDVNGNITFNGSLTVDNNLYVTGNLTIDGTLAVDDITADTITVPLITLSAGETIATSAGGIAVGSNVNVAVTTDVGGTPHVFDFREDGHLRLPSDGSNNLDAATVGQMNTAITAALGNGLIPVAAGAVVANALVSGSVGVTSVAHTGTGAYTVTLSSATTSTGKTLVFTTIRYDSITRNHMAMPTVVSTTSITMTTGYGDAFALADVDFNFMVLSLP